MLSSIARFTVFNCNSNSKLVLSRSFGANVHQSNRAKLGLFHGKDVRFGNSISHSGAKTRRKWSPNVIHKRVWSFAMEKWVTFNMTTTTLRQIDRIGGIDNYIASRRDEEIKNSNYILRNRHEIVNSMAEKQLLSESQLRRFDEIIGTPYDDKKRNAVIALNASKPKNTGKKVQFKKLAAKKSHLSPIPFELPFDLPEPFVE